MLLRRLQETGSLIVTAKQLGSMVPRADFGISNARKQKSVSAKPLLVLNSPPPTIRLCAMS